MASSGVIRGPDVPNACLLMRLRGVEPPRGYSPHKALNLVGSLCARVHMLVCRQFVVGAGRFGRIWRGVCYPGRCLIKPVPHRLAVSLKVGAARIIGRTFSRHHPGRRRRRCCRPTRSSNKPGVAPASSLATSIATSRAGGRARFATAEPRSSSPKVAGSRASSASGETLQQGEKPCQSPRPSDGACHGGANGSGVVRPWPRGVRVAIRSFCCRWRSSGF
jgi:hypothetical protein